MPTIQRNNHSPAFKKQIAIEAIREEKTIAQIASEYKVFPARIHEWKKKLLENGDQIFAASKAEIKLNIDLKSKEEEIAMLQKKIGQLVIENDFFKKKLNY
jgi:transposase